MRTRDGFTRCPECGSQFMSDHLAAHAASHKREADERRLEARDNPFSSSSEFFERIAPNIDATKDIGFVVRERGKYGSHAGHDGFDDESQS